MNIVNVNISFLPKFYSKLKNVKLNSATMIQNITTKKQ